MSNDLNLRRVRRRYANLVPVAVIRHAWSPAADQSDSILKLFQRLGIQPGDLFPKDTMQ